MTTITAAALIAALCHVAYCLIRSVARRAARRQGPEVGTFHGLCAEIARLTETVRPHRTAPQA